MRTVLGIDAAWTATRPSGVALIVDEGAGWTLKLAASSYGIFLAHADGGADPTLRPKGSIADVTEILALAEKVVGHPVDVVAVDMPLSLEPISTRRVSDNLVSSAYGARHCSTHTPSAIRPGKISDDLSMAFGVLGYPLATTDLTVPCLLEVYPHPALVELMSASRRLPYKQGKIRNYWPDQTVGGRKLRLLETWRSIVASLDARIAGTVAMLPLPDIEAKGFELKAFEDMLDAVVCCWVGAGALDRDAIPFGDATSAIWIPKPMWLSK